MKVFVYKNESDELTCPKCSEKINLNSEKINDIKSTIKNIDDTIRGAKLMIENIIKICTMDVVNIQLKNVNIIFNTLSEDIKKLNKKIDDLLNVKDIKTEINFNNYIIAEIDIKDEDINKNIKILSSYEEFLRTNPGKLENNIFKNEDEIKKCEIKINNEIIPFNYYYKFKSKGKYTIKYSFKNNLKCICLMFGDCKLLTKIDLSNFNTNNVTNMGCMFYGCSSLINVNLSDFNTNNVTDMGGMFYGCSSLTNINLSNFNTNNATDMNDMFFGCSSLKDINLSNFNTNNVTNMNGIFYGCSSLNKIDLSSFNTNKVTKMDYMFGDCPYLNKNNIIIKDKRIFNNKTLFKKV